MPQSNKGLFSEETKKGFGRTFPNKYYQQRKGPSQQESM
jgi:hypothetical protein